MYVKLSVWPIWDVTTLYIYVSLLNNNDEWTSIIVMNINSFCMVDVCHRGFCYFFRIMSAGLSGYISVILYAIIWNLHLFCDRVVRYNNESAAQLSSTASVLCKQKCRWLLKNNPPFCGGFLHCQNLVWMSLVEQKMSKISPKSQAIFFWWVWERIV